MPKRATLTFSSDDALHVKSQELHVFYCKYSGQHAMTTDCDLTRVGAFQVASTLLAVVDPMTLCSSDWPP